MHKLYVMGDACKRILQVQYVMGDGWSVYCLLCIVFRPSKRNTLRPRNANDADADADISTARSAASQKAGETYYDDALVRRRKRVVRTHKRMIGSIKFVLQGLLMSMAAVWKPRLRRVIPHPCARRYIESFQF